MPLDPQTGLPVATTTSPATSSSDPLFDPLAQISFDSQSTAGSLNNAAAPTMPDMSQVVLLDIPSPFSDAEYVPESHLTSTSDTSTQISIEPAPLPPTSPIIADMTYQEPISDDSYIPSAPLEPKQDAPAIEQLSPVEETLPAGSSESSPWSSEDYFVQKEGSEMQSESTTQPTVSLDRESTYEDDRGSDDHPDMPVINAFYELGDTLKELISIAESDASVPYVIEGKSAPDTYIQYGFLLIDSGNGLRITKTTTQGDTPKEEMLTFDYDIDSFTMQVLLNDAVVYTEGEGIPRSEEKKTILLEKMDGFMNMLDDAIEQKEQERQQQMIITQLQQF